MHRRSTTEGQSPVQVQRDDRIDDDDRMRVADDITAAVGAGLLELAEADRLLSRAWRARTRGELAATLDHVPAQWLAGRRRAEVAARQRERARQELPGHVLRWLGLVALLVAIWALTTPGGYFWPVWPALGTGSCLLGQVVAAAGRGVRGPGRGIGRAVTAEVRVAGTAS